MLEGTWGGLWSNIPLKAGAAGRSDFVAQDFIHLGLENLQGWRLDSPSWTAEPLWAACHTVSVLICPYILSETLDFNLMLIASHSTRRLAWPAGIKEMWGSACPTLPATTKGPVWLLHPAVGAVI